MLLREAVMSRRQFLINSFSSCLFGSNIPRCGRFLRVHRSEIYRKDISDSTFTFLLFLFFPRSVLCLPLCFGSPFLWWNPSHGCVHTCFSSPVGSMLGKRYLGRIPGSTKSFEGMLGWTEIDEGPLFPMNFMPFFFIMGAPTMAITTKIQPRLHR